MSILQDQHCYTVLHNLPLLNTEYVTQGLTAEYHLPPTDTRQKMLFNVPKLPSNVLSDPDSRPFAFSTIDARSTFAQTQFCRDLDREFGEVRAKFFYFRPWSGYDWHVDLGRKCAINIALDDYPDAVSLFRQRIDNQNYNVLSVPYPARRPVLFNTSVEHSVINLSDQPRHVLTVSFIEPTATYERVREFVLNYRCVSDSY